MGDDVNYKETLNLPKTGFPMRASLPKLEPRLLEEWEQVKLSTRLSANAEKRESFILHDGPPYANGDIHLGHTLNKVLKDIIVRSKTMAGKNSPYIPGWDCHGQPIEHEVEKRLGKKRAEVDTVEIRRLCREYALKFVDRQREQFKRLGVSGLWEQPYLTLNPEYEAANVRVFAELYEKGLIYKGRKPIHWCYRCRTALAEAEIEYGDEQSPSIYVKFPILGDFGPLQHVKAEKSLLIWTTTPWTLPANVAVAVSPGAAYVAVSDGDSVMVVAEALVKTISDVIGRKLEIVAKFSGQELSGLKCAHPILDYDSAVITADFVALDQGTGCVHIAPGHGQDDYLIGQEYGLPSPMPVDDAGVFTEAAGKFAGLHIKKANDEILTHLAEKGLLVWSGSIEHSYPHCWRCKQPVIFRATEQWFVSMSAGDLRARALQAIKAVKWVPDWSINRITGMVDERPDWCISRQRAWGVPIPVFYCKSCQEVMATPEVLAYVEEVFKARGADVWFTDEAASLMPDGVTCGKCGATDFQKETDIFDVWFESGVSHEAVLEKRPELSWPADLYLEGSDQHRGWFQSSLLTAVGARDSAPYREVLTHGFLVDGQGRKMSKSLGNVVDPLKVIERSGADILRLWVSSADYSSDIAVSDEILDRISEGYRRIRNTLRFLLGSISDFDLDHKVPLKDMDEIDRWALHRFNLLVQRVQGAYEDYRFHVVYHSIYSFCVVDMSSFYLDVLKDTLYTFSPDSDRRRSAQTALREIADGLIRLLAPILVFTAEEAWGHLNNDGVEHSVHLQGLPKVRPEYDDQHLGETWGELLRIRDEVSKALETTRSEKLIGSSLEARVVLRLPDAARSVAEAYATQLPAIFIVSQVEVSQEQASEVVVEVFKAEGTKCSRCWNYRIEVGKDEHHPGLCERCLSVVKELSAKKQPEGAH